MRRRFVRTAALGFAAAALPASAANLPLGSTAVPVPVVASSNIELLGTMPDVTAVSMSFASDKPIAYLNTLNGVSTYDISKPGQPVPLGVLPMPHFENESMALGERADGTKFLLVGIDQYNVAPTAGTAATKADGSFLVVVDVTDPKAPAIVSQLDTKTSTHTVQCVGAECKVAYTSGAYDSGKFEVIDLTNIKAPVIAKTVSGNVAALPAGTAVNGNHQWDADDSGLLWASGGAGLAAFDVSDPLNPKTVASTDPKGYAKPYNDFILHNSFRPGAKAFAQTRDETTGRLVSGSKETASPFDGNVVLATEEDYDNPVCGGAGGEGMFATWYLPYADAAQYKSDNPQNKIGKGAITPLDTWNTEILNSGQATVAGGLCSAHYFDYHSSGFVAQAWYQQGTRILDVRNPRDIKQVGYFFTGHSETWDAHWVPEYKDGKQTGNKSNIVYTNDATRGIDVLQVTLPTTAPAETAGLTAPILPSWVSGDTAAADVQADSLYGMLCRSSATGIHHA